MCVTLGQAEITGTKVYGYVGPRVDGVARHVVGYQNEAKNLTDSPNCMFLNYPGTDLQLVQPAARTRDLMGDITSSLLEIIRVERLRGGIMRSATVEDYGDYTIVRAQDPHSILGALRQVDMRRQPILNQQLERQADFFALMKPFDSFVLACFDGQVKPKHPIVTSYIPNDPSVLAVPGLDSHDGTTVPVIGAPVARRFKVAFGVHGMPHGHKVPYRDAVGPEWAPKKVVGFVDNRPEGPNGDYALPIEAITAKMQWLDESSTLAAQLLHTHL